MLNRLRVFLNIGLCMNQIFKRAQYSYMFACIFDKNLVNLFLNFKELLFNTEETKEKCQ